MAKKKKTYDDDDGRVIAPMNLDGMPWFHRERAPKQTPSDETGKRSEPMTREEKRAFMSGALKAVALVSLTFVGVYFLVILLMYLIF